LLLYDELQLYCPPTVTNYGILISLFSDMGFACAGESVKDTSQVQ